MELKNILEAILFSSAKPVTARKLQKGLQEFTAGADNCRYAKA